MAIVSEGPSNEFFSTANALSLGDTMQGSLSSTADWDFFKIAVASDGVLKLDFSAPTSSSNYYFFVGIYDGSQKLLASDYLGASASFSLGVPAAGSYYAAITKASLYSGGQYGVTVNMAAGSASGYESESNDSLATANAIAPEQTIKGQMANSQDVDFYSVKATATGALVVDFVAPNVSTGTTFTIGIYDAAGNLLASRDTGSTLSLSVAVAAPGNYYAKVTQGSNYDGGNYSLTAHNDGFSMLTAKNLGGTGSVALQLNASHDWYAVNLTAGISYEFALSGASLGGGTLTDPALTLCYSNGTLLENCDNFSYYSNGNLVNTANPQIAFTAPKTGTYYLMLGGNGGTGTLTLSEKTDTVASLAQALLELQASPDHRWNAGSPLGTPVSLSYSFLSATADGEKGFVAMTEAQKLVVKAVLEQYGAVANMAFTLVADPSLAQICFGTSSQLKSSGVTYSDVGAMKHADVFLNNSAGTPSLSDGSYSLTTLIHEIGHALGLKHPGSYDATGSPVSAPYLPAILDNEKFTVMSYVDNPDSTVYYNTPALLDIAAVQILYGASPAVSQPRTFSFSNSSSFVTAILGTGSSDTIDISNQSRGSTIFMTSGSLSSIGIGANGSSAHDNVAIPFGESLQNVINGPGSDLIVGNGLDNRFFGFAGADTIDGGGGNNTLVLQATSLDLNKASDNQLANIQNVDASSATPGVTLDLHSQTEAIRITGSAAGDTLIAGSGSDTLVGGAGNDTLDGGAGINIVELSGRLADYAIKKVAAGFAVTGAAQVDTLSNIQTIKFSDATLDLTRITGSATLAGVRSAYSLSNNGDGSAYLIDSVPGRDGVNHVLVGNLAAALQFTDQTTYVTGTVQGNVALLYRGALGRTPDMTGLNFWLGVDNSLPASAQALGSYSLSDVPGGFGGTLSIAGGFTQSQEFAEKYGALTDSQFVTQLYANVLDRTPDAPGNAYWMSALVSGQSREHVLVGFADSLEATANALVGYTGQSGFHAPWLFLV